MVARWAHNPKVASSSLAPATKIESDRMVAFFMFTVYVLYSTLFDKIYIGYTSDLEARLISHNQPPLKFKGIEWSLFLRLVPSLALFELILSRVPNPLVDR